MWGLCFIDSFSPFNLLCPLQVQPEEEFETNKQTRQTNKTSTSFPYNKSFKILKIKTIERNVKYLDRLSRMLPFQQNANFTFFTGRDLECFGLSLS